MAGPTDAQSLLLAIQLASDGQIDGLCGLVIQQAHALKPELVYRILLTYCPYDASSQDLTQLLTILHTGAEPSEALLAPIDTSPVKHLSASAALEELQHAALLPLPDIDHGVQGDLLVRFLLARARQIDSSSDDLLQFTQVISLYVERSDILRTWFVSRLLPLLRLKYENYPGGAVTITLQEMDNLHGRAGIGRLLQYATAPSAAVSIGQDLKGVVAPWIQGVNGAKRRKLRQMDDWHDPDDEISIWQDVNEWILATSLNNFDLAERAFVEWNGPRDIDNGGFRVPEEQETDAIEEERYAQVGLAMVYAAKATTPEALSAFRRLSKRIADISEVSNPSSFAHSSFSTLQTVTKACFLHNALLKPDNQLTMPSVDSLAFLEAVLSSVERLRHLKSQATVSDAASLCLFASRDQQKQELRRILQQISQQPQAKVNWDVVCSQIRWLGAWPGTTSHPAAHDPSQPVHGPLAKIEPEQLDIEILNAILAAGHLEAAVRIYAHNSGPLPPDLVEGTVQNAIFAAYDNATNGNRTRGGMKRAYDILRAFQPCFPETDSFRQISKLIAATHSLSYYHLTLQYGVPFQPVSIRVHKDPISLLDRVLEQNLKAYTKLDDLLSIGRNMVEAGLPVPQRQSSSPQNVETKLVDAEHRIIYLAITSALSSNDFGTAYSYISTRLSPSTASKCTDDTSWRAAYAAGQHRQLYSVTLQSQITALSRRMELLSLALGLAPTADPLPDILETWRRCEVEMEYLKSQEAEQNRNFDEKASNRISLNGSNVIPGGFGTIENDREDDIEETTRLASRRIQGQKSLVSINSGDPFEEEEGPIGLFAVARGAANALQRNVKTAGGSWVNAPGMQSYESKSQRTATAPPGSNTGEDRVRKRDMVSNMVTGGLVSGMSWVLGAPPTKAQERDNDDE